MGRDPGRPSGPRCAGPSEGLSQNRRWEHRMNTTESIIAELQSELDEHVGAGRHVASSHCRQQIIAHQTLARLRAEHDANPSEGLASQIRFWVRKTDRDVDPA